MKVSFLHWLLGDALTPALLVIKYSSVTVTWLFLPNLGTSFRHIMCFLHLPRDWFLGALGTFLSHRPWAETQTAPGEIEQQHLCSSFHFSHKKSQNFLKKYCKPWRNSAVTGHQQAAPELQQMPFSRNGSRVWPSLCVSGLSTALSVKFNSWLTHLIIEHVNILQEWLTSRLLSNQGSIRLRILKLAEPNNLQLSPSASHNLRSSHWRETCSQRKLMDSSSRHDTPETSNCYFIHMLQREMINGNL